MFEHLSAHRKILVTGPFRAGTTITSQMIAHDTGHQFLDENAFTSKVSDCAPRASYRLTHWRLLIWGNSQTVCEFLSCPRGVLTGRWCNDHDPLAHGHRLRHNYSSVYDRRLRHMGTVPSRGRFDWPVDIDKLRIVAQCPHMFKEIVDRPTPPDVLVVLMRRNLDDIHRSAQRQGLSFAGNAWDDASRRDYPRAVYDYWDGHPKPPQFLEVDYESLRAHPRYLPSAMRGDFAIKQTMMGPFQPLQPFLQAVPLPEWAR